MLQNPGAPTSLYATADLNTWINDARGWVAAESESVRRIATIQTIIGQRNYNFSALTIGDSSVAGVINVRRISYNLGTGQKWFQGREWEWFDLFYLNNVVPTNGPPQNWSQYGQGSAGQGAITGVGTGSMSSGSFYLDPPPDLIYTLNCDCVCYPATLAADTDPECIPYLFTEGVPFFAAYLALMSAQTNARMKDAEQLLGYYQSFMQRARRAANPSVNRGMFQQAQDPTMPAKLGLKQAANQ